MTGFEIVVSIILIALIITIPSLIIVFVVNYITNIPKERQVKIKYSDFIKWLSVEKEYNFTHTNWYLETYGPQFGYCCDAYYCYFNFFDYCKYRILFFRFNRKIKRNDMANRRLKIVRHINKDIQKSIQQNIEKNSVNNENINNKEE